MKKTKVAINFSGVTVVVPKAHVDVAKEVLGLKKDKTPPSSIIVLFTIKGHTTWRISLYPSRQAFENYLRGQPNHPEVVDKKFYKVDRITGNIIPEN